MDPSGRGEFAAIARLAERLPSPPAGQTWIGDDAAVLEAVDGPILFATDAVVAGVHVDLSIATLADLGWKALAVNLSDLAAMGGRPVAAVVAVAGPPDTDLDRLYDGLHDAAAQFGCPIVGGDLANATSLVVTVSVLGDGKGSPPPVRRAGGRPGDRVFVTGPLGASAAGLRQLRADPRASGPLVAAHRRPVPLLAAGRAARRGGATAMIDVSDGFGADLGHVLDASGVGVQVSDLPVADGATIDEALAGGEDYQLVFTAPDEAAVRAAFAAEGVDPPRVVGTCEADPAVRLVDGAPLPARGWEHPWR